MGYNGSNRKPKFDVGSKRDVKRASKLVVDIMAAPFILASKGRSRGRRKMSSSSAPVSPEQQANDVLFLTIIVTLLGLYTIIEMFVMGEILAGCIPLIPLIFLWWFAYRTKKVAVDTISKSSGNKVIDKKKDKKNEALSSFFLVLLFITPLYAFFTYFGFKIKLFFFPIIGELLLIGSTFLFFCFWWVAISELIKAYKKEEKDSTNKEIPPSQ